MCTISWLVKNGELSILFNRDESIKRPQAEVPRLYEGDGHLFLAPRDPLGGGTWLALRADGIAIALLNHYSAEPPKLSRMSRGKLVWQLAATADFATRRATLLGSLDGISPFHLLSLRQGAIHIDTWDGRALVSQEAPWPLGMFTTSSSEAARVCSRRARVFEEIKKKCITPTAMALMRFHQSVNHCDPDSSVLMDRGERRTLSQSLVEFDGIGGRFSYRKCFGLHSPPGAWIHTELKMLPAYSCESRLYPSANPSAPQQRG